MKAYSLDLRQRVLSAVLRGDRAIPEVAKINSPTKTVCKRLAANNSL